MRSIFYWLILIIILLGLWGAFGLVSEEWHNSHACPKLLQIPACYIIFSCLLLALMGHIFRIRRADDIYYLGVVPGLSIAVFATLGEIFDFANCPDTSLGVPACFISLGIFLSLYLLKKLQGRSAR